MKGPKRESLDLSGVRQYYDEVYHRHAGRQNHISRHLRRLAGRFQPWEGQRLLDVGCGTGEWLAAAVERGAIPAGVDISQNAVDICRRFLPDAEVYCCSAERLPFADGEFDFISCLGALEHFADAETALREMVRVARPDARFLLLVPNAGFLTRRLGFYAGTEQTDLREEVRTLAGWRELFESAGLRVEGRWKDLHVLSLSWILRGSWYFWPLRAAQALALPLWPLSWQYQVYHLCRLK